MSTSAKNVVKPNTRGNVKQQQDRRMTGLQALVDRFERIYAPNTEAEKIFAEKFHELCNRGIGHIKIDDVKDQFDPEDIFGLDMIKSRLPCSYISELVATLELAEVTRKEKRMVRNFIAKLLFDGQDLEWAEKMIDIEEENRKKRRQNMLKELINEGNSSHQTKGAHVQHIERHDENEDPNEPKNNSNLFPSCKTLPSNTDEKTTLQTPTGETTPTFRNLITGQQQKSDIIQHNRNASTLNNRFNNADEKFSGSLEEFFSDYLRTYRTICESLSMPNSRQLIMLHVFLRGSALDFYYQKVKPIAKTLEDAIRILRDRYEGPDRQSRTRQAMESLRIHQFILRDTQVPTYRDWSMALDKLVDKISSLSRQVAPQFRTDAHQVLTLQNAVIAQKWSENPLRNLREDGETLQTLHSALGREIQFLATRENSIQHSVEAKPTSVPIMFGKLSNPRYGKQHWVRDRPVPAHKRKFDKRSHASQSARPHIDPSTGMNRLDPNTGQPKRCRACDSKYHFAYERMCDPTRVVRSIRTRLVETDPTNVLADLLEAYIESPPEIDIHPHQDDKPESIIDARFGELLSKELSTDHSDSDSSRDEE